MALLGLTDGEIVLGLGGVVMTVITALVNLSVRQAIAKLKDIEAAQNAGAMRMTMLDDALASVRLEMEKTKTEAARNFATKFDLQAQVEQSKETTNEIKGMLQKMWDRMDENYRQLIGAINSKADKRGQE